MVVIILLKISREFKMNWKNRYDTPKTGDVVTAKPKSERTFKLYSRFHPINHLKSFTIGEISFTDNQNRTWYHIIEDENFNVLLYDVRKV